MTDIDRRSALILDPAGATLLASTDTAAAQEEAARNKALLAHRYKLWHETKGGSVNEWTEIVADNIAFGSLVEGRPAVLFTARIDGKQSLKGYFDGLLNGWSMIHYTVDHFIAEGDRVVMVGSTAWRNKATNKVCETTSGASATGWRSNTTSTTTPPRCCRRQSD